MIKRATFKNAKKKSVKKRISLPVKLPGNTAVALPKIKRILAFPKEPRGLSLPKPHVFQKWFPYFITGIIIIIAIVGAFLYYRATDKQDSVKANTNADDQEAVNIDASDVINVWEYQYYWTGSEMSQEIPSFASYSFSKPEVTQELFSGIKESLGLTGDVRTTNYDDGLVLYEAGVELPEQDILGFAEGDQVIDDAVLNDPEAYQLTTYSNQPIYWYGLISSSQWIAEHSSLPSDDQAKELASDFFQSRGLLPDDAQGPYIQGRGLISDSGSIVSDQDSGRKFISLYYQKTVNGLPVVDEAGDPIPYLTIDLAGDNKVISVSGPIQSLALNELGQSDKSQVQAWSEIENNLWDPGRRSNSQITSGQTKTAKTREFALEEVDQVYLSVAAATLDSLSYFEPAYRFSGSLLEQETTESYPINILVPAVTTSIYSEAVDILNQETFDSVLPY